MQTDATQLLYRPKGGRRSLRPQDGRQSNLSLILQSLFDEPQLTRADLARSTGLTRVTISDLVAKLIDESLVEETGWTAGIRPGKPAATLAVRADTYDIVALDMSAPDKVLGGVFSLYGEQRTALSIDLAGRTGQAAIDALLDMVGQCVSAATHPILGIGVGTPGTVDAVGSVISAPNLAWHEVPLQDMIFERFDLPVAVQNDANAAAVAERSFTDCPSSFIRVQVTKGVGAGILLSGSLILGGSAAAGEIGHVVIERDGVTCSCGKQGCLETWISVPALRGRVEADSGSQDEILAEAGRRLGMALAPVVAALDLHDIVLGGPADLLGGPFLQASQELIIDRTHS
ncbi:MAG: ROK family transcriptional regulator, partial [Propionibacteriaceae bacterium]|nr:ROK family transcriptional regulator [Propionibacteriaceae bacterium]